MIETKPCIKQLPALWAGLIGSPEEVTDRILGVEKEAIARMKPNGYGMRGVSQAIVDCLWVRRKRMVVLADAMRKDTGED